MTNEIIELLRAALGDGKVSVSASELETHGHDENYPQARPPLAVIFAEDAEDVRAALAWARETRTPVIPFGSGTSFEGQLVPLGPALSLDLSRMNRVLAIHPDDFLVEVEPGVTREALNTALRHTGLFFPVDPGANASLGGMAATNASGTTTVRYGGMRQNVAALEVILANGETLQLGRAVRKTSSGYDLKDLFIGSGGTLGVITRLTLRLHPVPEHVHTLRVFFPGLTEAAQAAYAIMANALPVARIELMDENGIRAINRHLGRSYREQPALFLEFHSSTASAIAEESRVAEEIMRDAGAVEVDLARSPEERTAQWEARHHIYWAMVNLFPGRTYTITDVAVPISHVTELVAYTQEQMARMRLDGGIVGHVGDGNFHTLVATLPGEYHHAEELSERLVRRALALGGTATGEHGVGLTKKKFMAEEHGAALDWMRRLKELFDPDGILNPGKIV
ncbi:MAG TPA: FAD-binding oxidoreductase [Ktedonobacterales bacterium]|nr:FAD-binding oxidoreductase [Ktedonobacterales bacterium]